jgi:tight adherence protein C
MFAGFDIIWLLLGLGLAAGSVYFFSSAILGSNPDSNALLWASGNEPKISKSGFVNFSRPLVHNFTLNHAAKVKSPDYRKRVEKKILTAGLADELNVDEFIGLQILWGLLAPIVFLLLNFTLQFGFPDLLAIIIAVFGVYFPHLHCSMSAKLRYNEVVADLPFFIDLLALSTKAGKDFVGAIQLITDKSQNSVLAEELKIVLKEIRLGSSRTDALKGLSARLDIPEITSFVAVVNDAEQSGAPVSSVLKEQSIQMRLERMMRAEKMGAQASQTMMIPMIFFIFPAVLIAVFGPAVMQFFGGGR